MFNRCVAILVLIGFFANQLATIPHAHAATLPEGQREHDSRRHIHVGAHSHDYGHAHTGHCHDHEGDKPTTRNNRCGHSEMARPNDSHDADAIYLPDGVSSCLVQRSDDSTTAAAWVLAGVALPASCCQHDLRGVPISLHPPDVVAAGGKLFLKLRNLRI